MPANSQQRVASQRPIAEFGARLVIFLSILLCSLPVHAENVYSTASCTEAAGPDLTPSSTREVFVYVEDDFAAEMTSCTPGPTDDGNVQEYAGKHPRMTDAEFFEFTHVATEEDLCDRPAPSVPVREPWEVTDDSP